MEKPPVNQYAFLYRLFRHYNELLFGDGLPVPLFTVARLPNVAGGVFSRKRWEDRQKREVHEITLSPVLFYQKKPMELHQVIVHEMAHLWQQEYGRPSRNGYHNKEWAAKMVEIGLIPSHTGAEGGKLTGQRISDYPKPGGKFIQAFDKVKNIRMPFEYIR